MIKKIAQQVLAMAALTSTTLSSQTVIQEFEEAWQNPQYTSIQLEDIDVNEVLCTYYKNPPHFTRKMVWDAERLKAWDPKTYIAHVVKEGKSWGKVTLNTGDEHFTRSTQQQQWLTGNYSQVIEKVFLLNKEQKAIFIGVSDTDDEQGQELHTINPQPLFYIEHGVAGTEDQPINTWRIVHLTPQKDVHLIKKFNALKDPTILLKYIEVYIKENLKINLERK